MKLPGASRLSGVRPDRTDATLSVWSRTPTDPLARLLVRSISGAIHRAVLDRTPGDTVVAVDPPSDVPAFRAARHPIAIVRGDEREWLADGALDAAERVLVLDDLMGARLDAGWARGLTNDAARLRSESVTPAAVFDLLGLDASTSIAQTSAPMIGVSTCVRRLEVAEQWGDTHFARGLVRAFRRLGCRAHEIVKSEWEGTRDHRCDVVIHLRGLARRPVERTGDRLEVLWVISHPDRIEPGELDEHDVVLVASHRFADELSTRTSRPVHVLPQATDADRFRPGRHDPRFTTPILSVGSSRYPPRRAPMWLARSPLTWDLYGLNWDGRPERRSRRSEYLPNHLLCRAYRSADIVVADHHGSMRAAGFVANRLYDVLASGGLVVSDDVDGLHEVLGDSVPVYRRRDELIELLQELLRDPDARRELSDRGRKLVASRHTLDHRAVEILDLLASPGRGHDIRSRVAVEL
ncbi:MAG: glycosyltransferase [Actinomycetota bacterium]